MKLILMLLMPLLVTACGLTEKPVPCAICYEDEWSREPFPGQAKQHIKPMTPEELKRNGGVMPLTPAVSE